MIYPHTIILSAFLFLFSTQFIWGQQWESPCGTPDIHSERLQEWQAQRGQIASLRNEDPIYVKMKVHIVGDDNGEGFYRLSNLLTSVCKLNEDMAPAGIYMEMDLDINYISSSRYNVHDFSTGAQMMSQYNEPGKVNCYIVADPAGNCGYFSPSRDAVALRKSCLGEASATWSHELGHFFSLPHTFSGWEGTMYEEGQVAPVRIGNRNRLVELADSSNCRIAGDGFCDTKADYLSYRWTCVNGLSPIVLTDPDSVNFRAVGENIMSYSNDVCQRIFSEEQADAMRFDITAGRVNHISSNEIPDPIDFESEDFEAMQGYDEEPMQYDDATIRWKSIEGADAYVVELTRVLPFSTAPSFEFLTTDTVLNFDFLDIDFFYDWEVYPFHPGDACAPSSGKNRFLATQLSSDETVVSKTQMQVFPNPVVSGSTVQLIYQMKNAGTIDLDLLDNKGKLIQNKRVNGFSGSNRLQIQAPQTSGLYFIRLTTAQEIQTKKVIVN